MNINVVEDIYMSWDRVKTSPNYREKFSFLFFERVHQLSSSLSSKFLETSTPHNEEGTNNADVGEFKPDRLKPHAFLFVGMLDLIVQLIGPDMESFTVKVWEFGRRHAKYGVKSQDYPIFGEALYGTLEDCIGKAYFTPQVKESWQTLWRWIGLTMIRGARSMEPPKQRRSRPSTSKREPRKQKSTPRTSRRDKIENVTSTDKGVGAGSNQPTRRRSVHSPPKPFTRRNYFFKQASFSGRGAFTKQSSFSNRSLPDSEASVSEGSSSSHKDESSPYLRKPILPDLVGCKDSGKGKTIHDKGSSALKSSSMMDLLSIGKKGERHSHGGRPCTKLKSSRSSQLLDIAVRKFAGKKKDCNQSKQNATFDQPNHSKRNTSFNKHLDASLTSASDWSFPEEEEEPSRSLSRRNDLSGFGKMGNIKLRHD